MTLTLEDVKNVRFPIAKRQGEGYRATEVDDFVDQVDATFGTMLEENERLKSQLAALDDAPAGTNAPAGTDRDELVSENERLKAELEQLRQQRPVAAVADNSELERLRQENNDLRGQLESARQSTGLSVVEGSEGGGRVEKVIVTTAAQASPAVTRLVQLATEQAEAVVAEARGEADRTINEAQVKAKNLTVDATTRAEKIESQARVEADRLNSEARANSEAVNSDAENRRRELFAQLEAERDELIGKVQGLRGFENTYRNNLADHLRTQLQVLDSGSVEPAETPSLLAGSEGQDGTSATPRLDALLAEGRAS